MVKGPPIEHSTDTHASSTRISTTTSQLPTGNSGLFRHSNPTTNSRLPTRSDQTRRHLTHRYASCPVDESDPRLPTPYPSPRLPKSPVYNGEARSRECRSRNTKAEPSVSWLRPSRRRTRKTYRRRQIPMLADQAPSKYPEQLSARDVLALGPRRTSFEGSPHPHLGSSRSRSVAPRTVSSTPQTNSMIRCQMNTPSPRQ